MAFVPYMAAGFAVDKLMGGDGLKGAALGGLGGAGLTGAFSGLGGTAAATTGGASSLGSGAALMGGGSTAATGGALGSGMGLSSIANPLAGATPLSSSSMGLSSIANPLAGASPISTPTLESLNAMSQVNPATTGGLSEGISAFTPDGISGTVGGNTGVFDQLTSNQTRNSALTGNKGLLDTAFENTTLNDFTNPVTNLLGRAQEGIDSNWADMSNFEKAQAGMGVASLGTTDDTKNKIQAQRPVVIPGKPAGKGVTAANVGANVEQPFTEYSATTIPQNLSREQLEELRLNEQFGL